MLRRHCLCAQHGLDLVGRRECPQAGDRDKKLPVAIFIRLPRREPAGVDHRVDEGLIEPVAPRSADGAQGGLGFGFVDADPIGLGLAAFRSRPVPSAIATPNDA